MPSSIMSKDPNHVSAGKFTRKIQIQQFTDTPDGYGSVTRVLTTLFTPFALIEPSPGSEAQFQTQLYPQQVYMITIRWRAGVYPGMRVLWNNVSMRIRSCQDYGLQHAFLSMYCEAIQTAGDIS